MQVHALEAIVHGVELDPCAVDERIDGAEILGIPTQIDLLRLAFEKMRGEHVAVIVDAHHDNTFARDLAARCISECETF